jgi:hypothetical protein
MYYTLLKPMYSIFVIIILCNVSIPDLSHAGPEDIGAIENMDDEHIT